MRTVALVLLTTAVVTGAVAVLVPIDGGPDRPVAGTVAGFRHEVGQRGVYHLRSQSRVTLADGSVATQELTATLASHVLAIEGDEAEVGFRLLEARLMVGGGRDRVRESMLTVPFVARLRGGEILATRFPDGLADVTTRQLDGLLRSFHCMTPSRGEPCTALGDDGLGRYRARYDRATDGTITRLKSAYVDGGSGAGVPCEVRILAARASLAIASAGSWLESATIHEHVEVSSAGNVAATVEQDTTLERRSDPAVTIPPAVATWLGSADAAALRSAREAERSMVAEIPARAATHEDRQRARELIARYLASEGNDMAALHALARQLAETPELADDVNVVLRAPDLADRVGAGLCHALELGGAPRCQTVLAEVGLDRRCRHHLRFAAAAALGAVTDPTPEAESALFELWSGHEPRLATAAHLALGNIASHLGNTDPARHEALRGALADGVAWAPDANRAVIALHAARNSHDAALAEVARARLHDPDPAVRGAAASAAAALGGSSVADDLDRALRAETDARVRTALVDGLADADNPAAMTTCAELVGTETDPRARAAMARILADRVGEEPRLVAILEELLQHETSDPIAAYVAGRLHRARVAGAGR